MDIYDLDNQFDFKKPSVQMLGRWQPWHEGHTKLFTKALCSIAVFPDAGHKS